MRLCELCKTRRPHLSHTEKLLHALVIYILKSQSSFSFRVTAAMMLIPLIKRDKTLVFTADLNWMSGRNVPIWPKVSIKNYFAGGKPMRDHALFCILRDCSTLLTEVIGEETSQSQ